jgi:hypothetical protein
MRTFVVAVGAIVGFVLMPAAAGAQSAKPVYPSAFGRVVSGEAVNDRTVGQNVSRTATATDFGVSDEIELFKEFVGSNPNPPGH